MSQACPSRPRISPSMWRHLAVAFTVAASTIDPKQPGRNTTQPSGWSFPPLLPAVTQEGWDTKQKNGGDGWPDSAFGCKGAHWWVAVGLGQEGGWGVASKPLQGLPSPRLCCPPVTGLPGVSRSVAWPPVLAAAVVPASPPISPLTPHSPPLHGPGSSGRSSWQPQQSRPTALGCGLAGLLARNGEVLRGRSAWAAVEGTGHLCEARRGHLCEPGLFIASCLDTLRWL